MSSDDKMSWKSGFGIAFLKVKELETAAQVELQIRILPENLSF